LSEKIPPIERSSGVVAVAQLESQHPAKPVREATRRLLVEQLPVLRIVARGLCRDAAEVEDLVQDVFEKALRAIDSVDLGQNPRGWMVTILHNLHIDRCRKRARQLPHLPCDEVPLPEPEPATVPQWAAMSVDDVHRAAAQLPDELRVPYVMFALEGRSYVDVAAALGIPKATVGTRLLRARVRLKEILSAGMEET
jgi:RNA polymerase sigma-70 factor (ECF subfamily)